MACQPSSLSDVAVAAVASRWLLLCAGANGAASNDWQWTAATFGLGCATPAAFAMSLAGSCATCSRLPRCGYLVR